MSHFYVPYCLWFIRVRYHFDSIKYFLNIEDLNLFVPALDIRFRYIYNLPARYNRYLFT